MAFNNQFSARILAAVASGALFANSGCGGTTRSDGAHLGTGGEIANRGGGGGEEIASSNTGGSVTSIGNGGSTTVGSPNSGLGVCSDTNRCYASDELQTFLEQHSNGSPTRVRNDVFSAADASIESAPDGGPCPIVNLQWQCGYFASDPWVEDGKCCYVVNEGSCCGRPFIVAGSHRTALAAHRADWSEPGLADALDIDLTSEMRAVLADSWLRDARLEHASIAAFARFSLDLLALGAPSEFIHDAQRAGADELRHARTCFAIASRYAGCELGPAALELDGVLLGQGLQSTILTTIEEGCVGETIAALFAREQAETAKDPVVRAELEKIAEDETRHAELGWAVVSWALARSGPDVLLAVLPAFERALSRQVPRKDPSCAEAGVWRQHGRLPEADQRRLIDQASRDVILPCAHRLLQVAKELQMRREAEQTVEISGCDPELAAPSA